MTDVLCDASVALKWFREKGEQEVDEARAILAAHRAGDALVAAVLDLTLYEVGNVLLKRHGAGLDFVARVLDVLASSCPPVAPTPAELRRAAELAERHGLSFYDASYAAVGATRGAILATADRALIDAGLGESASAVVARLGLERGG